MTGATVARDRDKDNTAKGQTTTRPNQMPRSTASATSTRKPLTTISSQGCMRLASGIGGGGPGSRLRQTAAAKQKAENSTSTVPVTTMSQCGSVLSKSALAPMPLASATSPVRTQAA